jgi:hypothetical protein
VYGIFKLRKGPSNLLLIMTITTPNGGKVFDPGSMDGLPGLIFQVRAIMGLDGVKALNLQNMVPEGISPPEWMSRHADPPKGMDFFQHSKYI